MQTHRFFINNSNIQKDSFVLSEKDVIHKIAKVLRLNKNDGIILVNEYGVEMDAVIETISPIVTGKIIQRKEQEANSDQLRLTLAQALPKAKKFDQIIRMNTEVGVSKFAPFESKFSIVKLDKLKDTKIERWEKIATEAARQSERNEIPEILKPIQFEELLELRAEQKILLHSRDISDSIELKSVINNNKFKDVIIAIGPEGGFSKEEVEKAIQKGWTVAYLDLPILRTETAGIVAASVILS